MLLKIVRLFFAYILFNGRRVKRLAVEVGDSARICDWFADFFKFTYNRESKYISVKSIKGPIIFDKRTLCYEN